MAISQIQPLVWANTALKSLFLTLIFLSFSTVSHAQVSGKAFEGFKAGSKDPIQIDANNLEVQDSKNKATFSGKVKVRQGSSVLTTDKLTAFYAKGSDRGAIDKLVFVGNVVVSSGKNTATAKSGSYNVKAQLVTMEGNVLVSQGKNAAKGKKLVVDLKTNIARFTGRVTTIITPNK